ncbi:MAG: DNA topoisomerase III [Clostridiales bacterium]|nr:DNA topoisomerase III [Clostridiales bacterium]
MAGKALVLAEKPSVAREIAEVMGARQRKEGYYEGGGYVVTWALGHLVTLADPEEYGAQYKTWSFDSLPMLPEKMKLVVIKQTAKQYNTVAALLRRPDIGEVVVATDAGREGELVARWILEKASCHKPLKRLWISSQTTKAIREGFANLKPGRDYDNLYQSAQSRAEADWLVGFNVTRALTCKFNAQLSGGRVQTPTLALIVSREKEIKAFTPKEYYTIKAQLEGFSATWADAKGQSRLYDKEKAQGIIDAAKGAPGGLGATVTAIARQYKQKTPPAAYDLTELQRDANKKYAYSAKETLSLMQSLYERHKLLTYPRTDSRYITEDVAATIPDRLRSVATGPYQALVKPLLSSRTTRYIVNAAKVTDHHAIIPTEEPPNLSKLTGEERNIYDLVVRRFLAVLSAPYEYEEIKLTLSIGKQSFFAKGKTDKAQGWKAVYGMSLADAEEEEGSDEADDLGSQSLPPLAQGDKRKVLQLALVTGKTKPPSRYTEASLLSAMENPRIEDKSLRDALQSTSGLGTPATRADIIEKLFSSFYIERRGKEIHPTSKGLQLIDLVPPDLKSAELTAKWEQTLTRISKGQDKSSAFIAEMRKYASSLVSAVMISDAVYRHDNLTREKCPDCGQFLLEVNGKKGQMLICSDRSCGYRKNVSFQTNARCPNCHKKLELRGEGEKRLFACVCGYREKYEEFEKRRAGAGASKQAVQQYMNQQKRDEGTANSAMAEALAKWKTQANA